MKKIKILALLCFAGVLMLVPNAFASDVKTSVGLGVGIYVPYSYDPTVRDNTCVGNDYGIQFYSGTDTYFVICTNIVHILTPISTSL